MRIAEPGTSLRVNQLIYDGMTTGLKDVNMCEMLAQNKRDAIRHAHALDHCKAIFAHAKEKKEVTERYDKKELLKAENLLCGACHGSLVELQKVYTKNNSYVMFIKHCLAL